VNIAIFLVAHLHLAAQVDIVSTLLGTQATYPGYETFNMLKVVRKLWKYEAYMMSVLLCLLGLIWPYVKLLGLLAVIFASSDWLSLERREKCLVIMDRLGKYSLLDFYFIILLFAMFIQLEFGTKSSLLLGDLVQVELTFVPCLGIQALIAGVLMSIFLNQVALSMHRRSMERLDGQEPGGFLGSQKEALCKHAWHVQLKSGFKQKLHPSAIILMILAMLSCAALMCYGWTVVLFDTQIHGIAGFIKQMQGESTTKPYSLVSMLIDMLTLANSQVEWSYYIWMVSLIAFHVVFAGVLPLLQIICMLVLWLKPLTLRSQKRLNLFIQVVSAVASVEVFLCAVVVGNLRLEHVIEGFGKQIDESQTSLLEGIATMGVIDIPHVIGLDLAFHGGFVLMAWAATLYCVLSSLIIEWSKHAESDRLLDFRRQQGQQVKPVEGQGHSSSSTGMGLFDEARAKFQYFCAFTQFIEITDLHGKEAMDEFWLQCHQGGLPIVKSDTSKLTSSLVAPLLKTEAKNGTHHP